MSYYVHAPSHLVATHNLTFSTERDPPSLALALAQRLAEACRARGDVEGFPTDYATHVRPSGQLRTRGGRNIDASRVVVRKGVVKVQSSSSHEAVLPACAKG